MNVDNSHPQKRINLKMCTSSTNLLIEEDSSKGSIHPDGLANDLINKIFREHPERGLHEESDSFPSSSLGQTPEKCKSTVDHRLEYWKNMLIQRRALQERLRNQVGRMPEQMVFNRQEKVVRRSVRGFVEIVGLPCHSAAQLLGGIDPKEEYLNEDYSKICDLEVVGRKCQDYQEIPIADPCSKTTIKKSSTELSRSSGGNELVQSVMTLQQPSTGPSVRINGFLYMPHVPEFSPIVDRTFICHPFRRHLRSIVHIENSGNHELRFSWKQVNFFSGNDTLMEADSGDFVFDVGPFMLSPGEFRDVTVLYQPRCVAIVKQRWLLSTKPRIFFCRPCGFTLNLNGRCTPPKEYLKRLEMETLENIPFLPPVHLEQRVSILCPYDRELDEREAFNRRNRSFHCQTHGDLDLLKQFYERAGPAPFLPWDYSVHSLIHRVCNDQDARQRIVHLSELTKLLDGVRGSHGLPLGRADSSERLKERYYTKVLYVRGILTSRLEEWDDQVQLLRTRMARGDYQEDSTHSKHFHDSIYIQLYGLICNAAEDIVSVIESTAQI
uniref:Uncharacterized protein LOC108050933 n=1 Tax=Drosophila rhopaloa TaxID=1041015 RepID=A0A6P4FEA1_DRORH